MSASDGWTLWACFVLAFWASACWKAAAAASLQASGRSIIKGGDGLGQRIVMVAVTVVTGGCSVVVSSGASSMVLVSGAC